MQTQCRETKSDGTPCRSFAITDDGFCRVHSLTPQQRSEEARKRQQRGTVLKRAKNDALLNHRAIALDKALAIAFNAIASDDVGERWAAANVLLRMTGVFDVYRLTASEMREKLDALIPPALREQLVPAWSGADAIRAERSRWYELRRRYSPVTGLYYEPLPDWLVPDGMTAEEIVALEAPDLSTGVVRQLPEEDGTQASHVRVEWPSGETEFVKHDAVQPPAPQRADHALAQRLATKALARREELLAT